MVHPIRDLLAACVAGVDCIPVRVADKPAIPDCGDHATRSFCSPERHIVSAGAIAARAARDLTFVLECRTSWI